MGLMHRDERDIAEAIVECFAAQGFQIATSEGTVTLHQLRLQYTSAYQMLAKIEDDQFIVDVTVRRRDR